MTCRGGFRVVVLGDNSVGKTSLIQALVTTSVPESVPSVIGPVAFPSRSSAAAPAAASSSSSSSPPPSHIIDTSSADSPESREALVGQIRAAHVVVIVADASRPETLESVERKWLPEIRRIRSQARQDPVAVVVAANKIDLRRRAGAGADDEGEGEDEGDGRLEDAFGGILDRNRDVESCLTCSARQMLYVGEVFELAQKAVVFPAAPLHDAAAGTMTPACTAALARCFRLLDHDKDGALDDSELNRFQQLSAGSSEANTASPLTPEEIAAIKTKVKRDAPDGIDGRGFVTLPGFLFLHHRLCQRGKCESTWRVLYSFGYSKALTLSESFLHPELDIPPTGRRYELGPSGIGFLADLFQRHDLDGDGLLSDAELAGLFSTAVPPGHPWGEGFPRETAHTSPTGDALTLRGFLAQFRMSALVDARGTLRLLAMLGFDGDVREALSIVRDPVVPGSPAAKAAAREDALASASGGLTIPPPPRTVFSCFVFGSRGSGKSSLLRGLLGKPFSAAYAPTTANVTVCNAVLVATEGAASADDVHLVASEFVNDDDIVHDSEAMSRCDVCCLVHDAHVPTSFAHVLRIHQFIIQHHPWMPCVHVATKSDLPAVRQVAIKSPDSFLRSRGLPAPIPVSMRDPSSPSSTQVFSVLARAAASPREWVSSGWGVGFARTMVATSASAAALTSWKRAASIGVSLALATVGSTALVAFVLKRWRQSRGIPPIFSWLLRLFPF